jgi:CRISPR-associated endonuclease/helicase Cas3
MRFIAHTKNGKEFTSEEETQLLCTHLLNVSEYARKFASAFDAEEVGSLIGLVHDLGKYQPGFQDRIRGVQRKIDHATLGAKVLADHWGDLGRLYGMVIAGHHTGLKDSGSGTNRGDDTYSARINNYVGEDVSYEDEIVLPVEFKHKQLSYDKQSKAFAMATYLRMLFSCLVDADWTDTEEYVTGIGRKAIDYSVEDLYSKVRNGIPLNNGSHLNNIRAEILEACEYASQGDQGIYTLTVPTGGGKTLSSLIFALKHAIKHGLKRIIYVIPYTSIIEQNADIIGKCVGKEFVLEHHSNAVIDRELDLPELTRLKWATENWDIPIIVTTNVQFFESLFSNRPARARKVHHIAESIVIFDEAQMLPREFLSASMYTISKLIRNYKVTAVLCSATQPAIAPYKYNSIPITEIISNPKELSTRLKRVCYETVGKLNDSEIISRIADYNKVLCIVNSRKHAHALFELAHQSGLEHVYHLSTLMCSCHRREVLKEIKDRLHNDESVKVIATSLIEAGVDIDFPVVMRAITGLDSIIQAGGRANREGRLTVGKVIVFEPDSDSGRTPNALRDYVSLTKEVIDVLENQAFELAGIKMYFELLYSASSSDNILDSKNILGEFEVGRSIKMNFETAADKYKLIEDNTKSIVINFDKDAAQMIKSIRNGEFSHELVRRIQQVSVSIYAHEYRRLLELNALEELRSGYVILNSTNYYNDEFGLDIFTDNNKNAECSIL